jgi:hypothetical protein
MPALLTLQNLFLLVIFCAGFASGYGFRHYISVRRRERARTIFDYDA